MAVLVYVALWLLDDVLLAAPMIASTVALGFWWAWLAWMAVFVIGGILLSRLVIRVALGATIPGRWRERLARWFLRYADDDPVAQWCRHIGGALTTALCTILLGPPIMAGLATLARTKRPSPQFVLAISVLYATIWVSAYTGITSMIRV